MVQLTWRNGLDEAEVAEVMGLLTQAREADGVEPVGEHVILRLRSHGTVHEQIEPVQGDVGGSEHFVVRDSGSVLVGYAHLDTSGGENDPLVAELAVLPSARRRGIGERLVHALLERAQLPGETAFESGVTETGSSVVPMDTGRLRVWAHGEHPGALRLAERFAFTRARDLWRMLLENDVELPAAAEPDGVRIRAFVPDSDEDAVVAVNHRAFSWHPEQGDMTVAELRRKEAEDWFDPAGFLLAENTSGDLLGFHWTKIHPDGTGEVYVVGVDPLAQGSGLGRALTLAGLVHLRNAGVPRIMLYVEGDNAAAVAVYRRLGFQRSDIDVQFGR